MKYYFYLAIFALAFNGYSSLKRGYYQNDYTLTLKRLIVIELNEDVFSSFKVTNFKPNRTTTLVNMTFTFAQDINEIKLFFLAYKWYVNEYKRTAIQSIFDGCMCLRYNLFGFGRIFKSGNMTDCPIKKGYYESYNIYFKSDQFPPNIPEGQYKLVADLFYTPNKIKGLTIEIYADIVYPLKINRKH